jgi:hypothetical protein
MNDHSTDHGGLSTWHQFHNPTSGKTLTVSVIVEERLFHPVVGDVNELLENEPVVGSA